MKTLCLSLLLASVARVPAMHNLPGNDTTLYNITGNGTTLYNITGNGTTGQKFIVFTGNSVDLECPERGSGTVSLGKGRSIGGTLTPVTVDGVRIQQRERTFTINNLERSKDFGYYQCITTLLDGRKRFDYIGKMTNFVSFSNGPTIGVRPKKQSALEGKTVVFTCDVVAKSRIIEVRWYKDAKEVSQSWQSYSSNSNLHKNVLTLTGLNANDKGVYECRVKAGYPAISSYYQERATLNVKEFAILGKSQEYLMAVVGSNVKINCRTSDHNASVSLWIEKRGGARTRLRPDKVKVVKKGKRFVIHNVALSDEGMYICKARNKRGKATEKNMGQLIASQGGYRDPKAHIYPNDLSRTLVVGEDFNFSCIALGDMITFEWTKDGAQVPTKKVTVLPAQDYQGLKMNEAHLMIKGATTADAGNYTCRIKSGVQPGYSHSSTARLNINECTKANGKLPDPGNPNGYVQCTNGNAEKRSCAGKQHWNDTLKQCQDPLAIPTTPFLRWIGKDYSPMTSAPLDGSFTFDCRTSDPSLVVTLEAKTPQGRRLVSGKRLTRKGQVFVLHNLKTEQDSAEYFCNAPGLMSRRLTNVNVDMHLTLTVRVGIGPRSTFKGVLDYGDTMKLTCISYNRGVVSWYRVDRNNPTLDHPITKGVKPKEEYVGINHLRISNTLTLSSVTEKEIGSYMCRKKNRIGAIANDTIDVDVKVPTKPSASINSRYSKKELKTIKIRCNVTGSPWPAVTWLRRDTIVAECIGGQHPRCRSEGQSKPSRYLAKVKKYSHSLLEIKRAEYPLDNTVFTCRARNMKGEVKDRTNVEVFAAPKIEKINGPIDTISVLRSSKPKLVCKILRSNPPPIVNWQFQRWPCTAKEQKCDYKHQNWQSVSRNRGKIIETGAYNSTLEIPPSKDFAFYRCTAGNLVAQDSLVFAVHRTIPQANKLLGIKGLAEKQHDEHQNITLECTGHSAFDSPPYWLDKSHRRIVDSARMFMTIKSRPLINTTRLHIIDASVNDTGFYTCAAKKKDSTDTASTSIELNVLAVTAPTVRLDNQTAIEDDTVTIQCHVTGHPTPTVQWHKDGHDLVPRLALSSASDCQNRLNGLYHLDKQDNTYYTLVICNARYNDSGMYECRAKNKLGDGNGYGYLDILAKPVISFIPDNIGPLDLWQPGDELHVECRATGNPQPNVRWMKESEDGSFFLVTENSTLRILSLDKDDFGTYLCEAGNSLDVVKEEYIIRIPPKVGRAFRERNGGAISKPALVALVVVAGIVIVLLVIIIGVLYRRKKIYGGFYIFTLPPMEDYFKRLDPSRPLLEQTNKLPLNAEWEFPRDRIKLQKVIGSGAFGQVYLTEAVGIVAFDPRASIKGKGRRRSRFGSTRSQYQGNKQVTKVACKGLKENATESEYRDLLSELKILMHIGEHKNIVNLLGACTKGRECDLLVIIEYCPHGNLLEFLRRRRDVFEPRWAPATEKPDEIFTLSDLVITSFQVSRAMQFLASRRCVHRDLAARNVLVGRDYVMKIADFGLARDIYKNEHYVKTTAGLLPVKWMAIEALVDQVYTHSSDVWSFGVLLWETFTLGGSPYPGLPANEVYQYLMEGQRMEQPEDCPDEMYELMLSCWKHDPSQRPTFTELLESIDKILEEKTTETGECYLDLENDDTPFLEDQPEYLEPELLHSPFPPETPVEDKNFPLPPVPYEEIELKDISHVQLPDSNENNKKEYILKDAPKGKSNPGRIDSEIEKVHRDSMERERCKKSESSASSSSPSMEGEFISEKERRDDDEEKDICERNSGVFNDSPPPYINTRPLLVDLNSSPDYANDVGSYRKGRNGYRPIKQSIDA